MACYVVPTAVMLVGFLFRKKYNWHSAHARWFTLVFAGGSVFGFVDHLWNGELLAFSAGDLFLGGVITIALAVVWALAVLLDKAGVIHPAGA